MFDAAIHNQFTVFKAMLLAGSDVNTHDVLNQTALHYASDHGYTDIVDELLKYKAHVNLASFNGTTPLIAASSAGHNDIVVKLLKTSANIDATDRRGFSALMYAAAKARVHIVKLLLKSGADIYRDVLHCSRILPGDSEDLQQCKLEVQRLLTFHITKRELNPQIEHLLERKKLSQLAQASMENKLRESGSGTVAEDIVGIIKRYI